MVNLEPATDRPANVAATWVALAALLLAGCGKAAVPVAAKQASQRAFAERMPGVKGLENVGRVAPGIYRGSTPTMEGLDSLRALGIKTVINLRHYHGSREERACRSRGLDYVRIGLPSSDSPRDEDVRKFLAIATDSQRQPLYFHCWRGKDRTGVMCAAYRMTIEDWPLADALAEMDAYGFFSGWRDLRGFVERFSERRDLFRQQTATPNR
jgi:tyrosine-protein phosphatase SIW14